MTLMRPQLGAVLALALTTLAVNACSGSSSDSSDDDASGAKGAILSGGVPGSSGKGTAGNGATTFTSGGSSAALGGTSSGAGRGGTLAGGGGSDDAGADDGNGKGGSTGGTTSAGGRAGTGGMSAGGPGISGAGGGPGSLGSSCAAEADCAAGLVCITSDSTTLGDGSPAGGFCTLACTEHSQCAALTPGAYCVGFDTDGTIAYCLEPCTAGEAGAPKCQQRDDFGCNIVGLADSTVSCTSSDDCGTGQLCDPDTSVCGDAVTACNPTCRGDFDCPSSRHCEFSTGFCVDGKAQGLPFGAACDTSASTDPCAGACVPVRATGTDGMCMGLCTLNADATGCGWDGTGSADAACLFQYLPTAQGDVSVGDVLLCAGLCDCNDDCHGSYCFADDTGYLQAIWGRSGLCRPLDTGETEADSVVCK